MRPQVIKGEEKRNHDKKGDMTEDEQRVDDERIQQKHKRYDVEGMDNVQEKKVEYRKDAFFASVIRKHEPRKQNGFAYVTPRPSQVHPVHLTEL